MSASPIMHLIPVNDLVDHTIPTEQAHLEHIGDSTWAAVRVPHRGNHMACLCGPTYVVCRACTATHGVVVHHSLDARATADLACCPQAASGEVP